MKSVIIFDGVCNFCNSSVNFIMKRDPEAKFLFTANQNEAGQKILKEHNVDVLNISTFFLYENGKIYSKSTAALRVARQMSFPWNLLYGFIIIPAFIRDIIYDFIAKNRYNWFGKKESCRLPKPEERARFLS
ncbi:MAG: thiol-disulfide oxidoreductase DCC family protein [Bacteroidia bacterium]|nr:thiol-disulfide oxidoreductase DCC family protein [Bacteroidia bacterium]